MKIIFLVAHLCSGGAERTVSYLSSYLSKENDVTVLSLSDDIFYELNHDVNLKSLHINNKSANPLIRLCLAAKRFIDINRLLKKEHYDVVFCMLPQMAKYVLKLHKKGNFKLITSERINPAIIKDRGSIELRKKVYGQSDGIVFQTQRAMDFYPEVVRKKGIVIHNAVGNELVYDASAVKIRVNKITAIGRLDDQKDYPCLLNAFKNVIERHPDFTLEIFGEGADRAKLEKLSEDLNANDNVKFMGAHRDAILKAADSACYVMSSKFEGMPNALMEAMAIGLPCISTDCPNGPGELIINGENGLLVPVGDVEALSNAILKMIEDKDFAEKCGSNARKILDTHSIEIKAKEYMEFIEKVCNEE